MRSFTRRGFLAAGAATLAATQFPIPVFGQTAAPLRLAATRRTLDIDGRAATVFGLSGPGGQGLVLDPGQRFRVDLSNDLPVPTIVHWHGQIPPNVQDGVPDMPQPLLAPGETRSFDFAPLAGTHWMHSHVPIQEMQLLAAPLIVRRPEDLAADRQDVVLFLHDFSFKAPEEVLAEITGGHAGTAPSGAVQGMDHGSMAGMNMDSAGTTGAMAMPMDMGNMAGMGGMTMDLNDYDWMPILPMTARCPIPRSCRSSAADGSGCASSMPPLPRFSGSIRAR